MWKEVTQQAFECGAAGWPKITGGEMFNGGEFAEYGQRDAYWRTETRDGVTKYFQFVWSAGR